MSKDGNRQGKWTRRSREEWQALLNRFSDGYAAYARERRLGLEVFLTDPDVPIDTNHLERALRAIPMGRNYPRSIIRQGLPPRAATCVAGRVHEFA